MSLRVQLQPGILALLLMIGGAGCSTPKPAVQVDPALAQLSSSARAAYNRGALTQAVAFYERAFLRARVVDDSRELALTGYNLAACYLILNRPVDARRVLKDAIPEFTRSGQDVIPARLLDAQAARALGRVDKAGDILDEVIKDSPDEGHRMQAWILKGEMACDAGSGGEAIVALNAAKKLSTSDQVPGAGRDMLEARVEQIKGSPTKAAVAYDRAARTYQKAGRYREMATALTKAGLAHLDAAATEPACDRLYRASRSYFAQGDAVASLKVLEAALAAAERSDDPSWKDRISILLDQVRASVEKAKAGGGSE